MTQRVSIDQSASGVSDTRRWAMLAASTGAQAAGAVTIHGPAFLIPVLHTRYDMSLAEAGLVAAAPIVGVMLSLVLWGAVVDRSGERFVLVVGLAGTAAAGGVAASLENLWLIALALLVAGAAAASTSSASGRVVVGWFPPHRRGLAMGVRQMAQPVGVGVAALTMAVIADRYSVAIALLVPAIAAAVSVAVVAAVVVDPPRPKLRPGVVHQNPYVGNRYLARIHGVSVLLVVPQFLVWTFGLVWLVQERDWSPAAAGVVVAAAQVSGALGRVVAGHLSDVVSSRMQPLKWVSAVAAASMVALGLTADLGWPVAVALMVVATTITVADNGLAFTAVAERAGPFWSGRALGVQNTAQYLAASAVPPVAGLAIAHWGYGAAFAASALFPLLAIAIVPVAAEKALT